MKKIPFLSTIPPLAAALLISALSTIYSCTSSDPQPAPVAATPGSTTVVSPGSSTTAASGVILPFTDYLAATPELSLLKAAVARAGMGTTLNAGQITVFAPTNDAFKAAGYADEAAINAVAPETLKQILQYHVLNDKVDYPAFPTEVSTIYQTQLANAKVYVYKTSAGVVTVNNATVTKPNQLAVNTVIHFINRVLLPNNQNTVDYAKGNPNLSLFAAAVAQAGSAVQTALSQSTKNGITVFAPTNDAFKAAGYADEAAIKSADATKLAALLNYHIVPSIIFTPAFKNNTDLTTLQGNTLKVMVSGGKVTLSGKGNGTNVSTVTQGDVTLGNGVVHIIDRVLLPQ